MSSAQPCFLRRWVHSCEEDIEHARTYRPSDWQLPRSRPPRHVLEFEPDRFVSRVGGPADSFVTREGRWSVDPGEPDLLQLEWQDATQPAFIEIVSCSDELLQVRVISGSIE
ncbi:hypothetical protein SAMN05216386_1696 [Nitrosospira briensis]|uniref:Uncharacterized protein n=1 Tax=Nitrosospira briensis TaxID=35799 RepID=A0A1I5BK19_9PROT|nr:hypothetical protein [Nitrosospira briensis]SFN74821.1 hypothetical protein SAMN05216386_1696 [Nitrosospira briensis]